MNADILIGVGFLVFGALWVIHWLFGDDAETAAQKTTDKAVGVGSGAAGASLAVSGGLLEAFLQEPGIIITVLGLGGILGGFQWSTFLAGAVLTYVLHAAVTDDDGGD